MLLPLKVISTEILMVFTKPGIVLGPSVGGTCDDESVNPLHHPKRSAFKIQQHTQRAGFIFIGNLRVASDLPKEVEADPGVVFGVAVGEGNDAPQWCSFGHPSGPACMLSAGLHSRMSVFCISVLHTADLC